jgi:hypothetical protein
MSTKSGIQDRLDVIEGRFRELYPETVLPWDNGMYPQLPSSNKVLYLELMLAHRLGGLEVTWAESLDETPTWHRILKVVAKPSQRRGSPVPGLPWQFLFSFKGNIRWKSMGFTLTRTSDSVWHYVLEPAADCRVTVPAPFRGPPRAGGQTPWTFTQEWAQKRTAIETRYLELYPLEARLPWHDGRGAAVGNTSKALYIQLEMHCRDGVVTMTKADPPGSGLMWHDIQRITVPRDKLPIFDAGLVPSQYSCWISREKQAERAEAEQRKHMYKTVHKIWRTFGLVETAQADGSLVYECTMAAVANIQRQNLMLKQKRSHSGKRRSSSAAAQVPAALQGARGVKPTSGGIPVPRLLND